MHFFREFSHFSYDFNTHKIILMKNMPAFEKEKILIARFLQHVPLGNQNRKGFLSFLLSYLVFSQI